jgi:hypothetical protein
MMLAKLPSEKLPVFKENAFKLQLLIENMQSEILKLAGLRSPIPPFGGCNLQDQLRPCRSMQLEGTFEANSLSGCGSQLRG